MWKNFFEANPPSLDICALVCSLVELQRFMASESILMNIVQMKMRISDHMACEGTVELSLCWEMRRNHHIIMSMLHSWIIMISSFSASLLTAAAGWGVKESAALDTHTHTLKDRISWLFREKWKLYWLHHLSLTAYEIVMLDFQFYFLSCGTVILP